MKEDAQYWLRRVIVKLYKDFMAGMDFEIDEHRWIFDWNEELTVEENLDNVVAEDKALVTLTNVGVIRSSSKTNYFRDQQLESLANPEKLGMGMWGDRWEATDPAQREYDYIRFIDNLDYDMFIQFCSEHSLNYKEDGVMATLTITEQRPCVRAEGQEYVFKPLAGGTTLDIIEKINANSHFNSPTTFDDLRRWLKNPNAFREQDNFNQIFREGNVFHKGNALSPFANIKSKSFTLKNEALLSPSQLATIQNNSIN
jgi:hypothetical protein